MGQKTRMARDRKRLGQRRRPTVCIAYISPGETSAYFTASLMATVLVGYQQGWLANVYQEHSSANVSAARNTVTDRFLDTRGPDGQPVGDYLLWVDADMQWDPEAVLTLLEAADPVEAPIVGGLCFGVADEGLYPTIYMAMPVGVGITTVRVRDYLRNSMMRVAATGAAFLLIHRSALEKMRAANFDPAFPFFAESSGQDEKGDPKPVGEDVTFCMRAAHCGLNVWVHTSAKIGHHKSWVLDEPMFDRQNPPTTCPADVGLVIPTRGDHMDLLHGLLLTAGLPPERVVVVDTSPDGLGDLPATVVRDTGPINIHGWWNMGMDFLEHAGCRFAAVLNDDMVIAPDTLPRLARGIGSATLAVPEVQGDAFGHCWMLNLEHRVRPDERYRWWCGDLQLWADAEQAGGVVTVPGAWTVHLHANEATTDSPELAALAEADGALYDARHPAGSRWARTAKEES